MRLVWYELHDKLLDSIRGIALKTNDALDLARLDSRKQIDIIRGFGTLNTHRLRIIMYKGVGKLTLLCIIPVIGLESRLIVYISFTENHTKVLGGWCNDQFDVL